MEDTTIERVLEITAGHPHDTQELCHFAWDAAARERVVATAGLVGEGFRQRHQLGSVGTVQKSLAVLLRRDVVEGSSVHGYSVPEVFFRAWIAASVDAL
jgi:hypothetical protein